MRSQSTKLLVTMNKLPTAKRAAIVRALCEGNSIRATARLTGTAKATVLSLLVELGEFCSLYQHHVLVNLPATRVEADEIWAFVGAKQKNRTQESQGDLWTFTALDADSKLMISWLVGNRSATNAVEFMKDVAARLANRVQLTTDGHHMYLTAVEKAFGYNKVDYAQLVKSYGSADDQGPGRRYSPMVCTGIAKERIMGNPVEELVSTSYVERANLSMRTQMRRFTRLTNAFSKKAENHSHAVSLYFMFYNFCRVHQTLTKERKGVHTTPAMAAGIADHVWKVEEILALMDPATMLQSK
jgi:IS1 family transposase